MAAEPTYPEDMPVGDPVGRPAGVEPSAKAAGDDSAAAPKRSRKLAAGAAIGIGSAALVAALLYANRSRKAGSDKDG